MHATKPPKHVTWGQSITLTLTRAQQCGPTRTGQLLFDETYPGRQVVDCGGVCLVHERDVSIAAGTSGLKLRLALRHRGTIPVLAIHIVRYDTISKRAHDTGDTTAGLEVGRPHVGWLLAEDIDKGLLELGHLRRELRRRHGPHVAVRPCVGRDLMAAIVGSLDRCCLVVYAAWWSL